MAHRRDPDWSDRSDRRRNAPLFRTRALTDPPQASYAASVAALDGMIGSTDPADARALTALIRMARSGDEHGDGRLGFAVDTLARLRVSRGCPRETETKSTETSMPR